MANCSSDLSYMPDEFIELLWDNGPVIQGPSNRPRKSSIFTSLSPSGDRVSERDGKDDPFPKIGHFRATEPKLNNFLPSGSPAGFGMNAQDDDIVRWIYPMEDPLHNDYCTEFLNDYSGVNLNSTHSETNTVPVIRGSFIDQAVRDSHNVEHGHASETSRTRASHPFQLPTQFKSSVPSSKSSGMDISIGGSSKAHKESGLAVMNFSHFSRPVALARSNVQGVGRSEGNNKAVCVMRSNPMSSTMIEPTSGLKTVKGTQDQLSSVQPNGDLISSPKPPQDVILPDKSKAVCEGEISGKNRNPITANTSNRSPERVQSSSFAASAALGKHETEKCNEAVVASSSVCSGCSAGAASNDRKHRGEKKLHEGEEYGYQSDDLDDESVDLKKSGTIQGKSKKRSRAAEVHNLSERRRRDRINERMRALQELIPNCNKTDKASMLDEAIEYLKSLQMQVQIMSMGGGLCMPPMIMQHMRAPTMAHFPPMGIGMGMGMGLSYGMGMYDMNGSPGCSFIPFSPIQGPQFACPPIARPPGLHRVPGPNSLQVFGIPGQGLPVSMPYRLPSVSSADTSTSPAAATKSENQQQQNKTLGKTKRSDTDDLQI